MKTSGKITEVAQRARWRDAEILVRFRQNASATATDALLQANGAQRAGQLRGQSGVERLRLLSGSDPSAVALSLRSSRLIDFAEPNYLITADQIIPNDPRFSEQWALKNTGTAGGHYGADINAARGWELTTGSRQTVVAIIDSGIDFTHPDLRDNQWNNSSEQANGLDDDNDGFADDPHGWDFVIDSSEIKDMRGHGTGLAGIIAARGNNAIGITGVMWRASLMSLRVLDNIGTGDVAHAVEAIDYAVKNGAQVINCSWGTDDYSVALREAVNRASRRGIVVVASAGNSSRDIETAPRYPASYDLDNLIAVASTDGSDLTAAWSNWGATHTTIAAPGTDILTTKMGGDYQTLSGTSAATALVTGVAGLIKTVRPWLSADRTREMILRGARSVPSLSDKVAAKGVVNAAGALEALKALPRTEGLDASNGNNGGEHRTNESRRGNRIENRPDAGNANRDGGEYAVKPLAPTRGAPSPGLPNLDGLRRRQPVSPQTPLPIPSTRCSHREPDCASPKRQASVKSQTAWLAWNAQASPTESLLRDDSRAVSDSPFKLGWIAQPLLTVLATQPQATRTNFARASNGGVVTASSTTPDSEFPGLTFPASGVIDGDRRGSNWEHGGGWRDGTSTYPDWLQIDFNGNKTIDEIDVVTIQDNYSSPSEPTEAMTFSLNGITAFDAQYWDGSGWQTVAGGSVTGNNRVWKKLSFTPLTTGKIRVLINNALNGRSRVIEVEAWGTPPPTRTNVALAANGATATASSATPDTEIPGYEFHTISANDGDRAALFYPHNGFWRDGTANSYPDWLQIAFTSAKTINEIDVFTIQDNIDTTTPQQPTESMTFTQSGISAFDVQYWDGASWATVSNGSVTGNNRVWRKFAFPPVTTDKIRILVNDALNSRSRIVELEAWEGSGSLSEPSGNNYSMARIDPNNRMGSSGVDLLSRNASWSLPILGLKGRAGLDLSLTLSYNSLVWTKDAASNSIKFDADQGSPGPGFRLGFPVIQQPFYNSQTGVNAYLLITPSGNHVELRQTGTPNIYESADSSYLQLTDNGNGSLTLRPTDGSQLTYELKNGQYQCTEIKDRNGNFITVSYYTDGRINTITDTLARVIAFNYDSYLNLTSITQNWIVNGQPVTHLWATFGWGNRTINTGFSGMAVIGPQNNTSIPVLTQVAFADGTRYNFEYNAYAQVYLARHYAADNHQLSYTFYTLPASSTDCPRVTSQFDWAEYWNNNQEAVTAYSTAADYSSGQMTAPDGTIHKELFATAGWQKGLITGTEFWSASVNGAPGAKKKWTTTAYTQDDTNLTYRKNPRVVETNVYDSDGNHKRTTVEYGSYAQWGLPYLVKEYAADNVTPIRQTFTDYNLNPEYLNRRVIGLVSAVRLSDGAWQEKTVFEYDAGGDQLQATQAAATQHDASYHTGFRVGRGNLTSVARYDVTDPDNESKALVTRTGYDTDGSLLFKRDALNHQTSLSYADSFSDGVNRNTFAYATSATDEDNYVSTSRYSYDFGATMRTQSPTPAGQAQGAIQTFEYDTAGRISRVNNVNNGSYRRWVYDLSGYVSTFDTIQSGSPEAYSTVVYDGRGRVRATGGDNPNSTGGYRGQFTLYDVMGRAIQTSNPAEMTGSWSPTGDDAAGWIWTAQAYDWKGRQTVTTNPDGTTKEATYGGCGCAGGEVVTFRDEVGRRQRVTSDVLGRPFKTELLNMDQTQSVYSTTINTYNARDQVTNVRQYQGTEASAIFQDSSMTYDGYGRLLTSRAPEQAAPTRYTYNQDSTTKVLTDARGATTTFSYNNRQLVTGITYGAPAGMTNTASVSFTYDAAGNRTGMTDGLGSTTYQYDQLSRLKQETRTFNDLPNSPFTLTYSYNLSGQLSSLTDPFGYVINYGRDQLGRISSVTGAGPSMTSYSSNIQYRAWGAIKHEAYGNSRKLDIRYDGRLKITDFEIAGVLAADYQYYADGRLRASQDPGNAHLDRAYSYDQVGRLNEALSGSEAHGINVPDGPYKETYTYDVWDNMVGRSNRIGQQTLPAYTTTYQNGRNTQWQYDAEGLLSSDVGNNYRYDAAGQRVWQTLGSQSFSNDYDGDGQRVKEVESNAHCQTSESIYFIRSSVLGGRVVSQIGGRTGTSSSSWQQLTYIYAGQRLLATYIIQKVGGQGIEYRIWKHRSPSGSTQWSTDANGVASDSVEIDPLQGQVGGTHAGDYEDCRGERRDTGIYLKFGDATNLASGCEVEGLTTACSEAMRLVNLGLVSSSDVVINQGAARGGTLSGGGEAGAGLLSGSLSGGESIWVDDPGHETYETVCDETGCYPVPTAYSGGGHFVQVGGAQQQQQTLQESGSGHIDGKGATTCGINPITGESGFSFEPKGVAGHLRPGVGGRGEFGAPRRGKLNGHQGLDISGPIGQPVIANRGGTVISGYGLVGGNAVYISHGDGVITSYFHLDSITVKSGQVEIGQQIGTVGMTGNAKNLEPTESHVHFGVSVNGVNHDPAAYLNSPCPQLKTKTGVKR